MVTDAIVLDVVEDWPAAQVRNGPSGLVEFHQGLALGLDVVNAEAKMLEDGSSWTRQAELGERYLCVAETVPSLNSRSLDGESWDVAQKDGLMV